MRSAILSLNVAIAGAVCSPCYEKPPACTGSETSVQITGVTGDFCSPLCVQNECPKGDGSFTAKPSCVLETQGSSKPTQCALICTPGSNGACPTGATCQAIQGEGICTYPSSTNEAKTSASLVVSTAARWAAFKRTFDRVYAAGEEAKRFAIFSANMADADAKSTSTLSFGATKFSDLTAKEFKALLNYRAVPGAHAALPEVAAESYLAAPEANVTQRDWRGNLTTPVKDQGQCGSCWAFSATEQIESMWLKKDKGKAVPLSAQQITSCDTADLGCNGGDTPTAYESVIKKGGIMSEKEYPYTSGNGKSGKCKFEKGKAVVDIKSYAKVGKKKEGAMQAYVGGTAPLSICVDATEWQTYRSGVMTAKHCCKKKCELDHCVQIIGFETKGSEPYWLIRNRCVGTTVAPRRCWHPFNRHLARPSPARPSFGHRRFIYAAPPHRRHRPSLTPLTAGTRTGARRGTSALPSATTRAASRTSRPR